MSWVLLPDGSSRAVGPLAKAYQGVIRSCRSGIGRLTRMHEQQDRKLSGVTPTGTLGELERSRDLTELYERLRQRNDRRIRELKVQIGSWEAEPDELRSPRK